MLHDVFIITIIMLYIGCFDIHILYDSNLVIVFRRNNLKSFWCLGWEKGHNEAEWNETKLMIEKFRCLIIFLR